VGNTTAMNTGLNSTLGDVGQQHKKLSFSPNANEFQRKKASTVRPTVEQLIEKLDVSDEEVVIN